MNDLEADRETSVEIAPEIIRVAVARVSASEVFEKSGRARRLLEFLAGEALAGRAAETSFQSVQSALYESFEPHEREKVARSDKRRLAELLQRYFSAEGREDALHIFVVPEGLKLEFAFAEQEQSEAEHKARTLFRRNWALLVVIAMLLGAILVSKLMPDLFGAKQSEHVFSPPWHSGTEGQFSNADFLPGTENLSLPTPEKLDLLARNHMFSFMDMERQKRVVAHSKAVIARFPDHAGSYATAAHSLSNMAILTRGSSASLAYLEEASAMVERAQVLAADDPWTLSAGGWLAAGLRDWDNARALSARAHAAGGESREILVFRALILLFSGDFQTAADVTAPKENEPQSGDIGIHGFAKFYLEDYEGAVAAFEQSMTRGGDPTPVGSAYVAAAYQAVGRSETAARVVASIREKWPTFRPELVHQVFAPEISEIHGLTFLKLFCDAGWELDA
ncbi:hypothetical protein [Shimia sp.]|uniref:hypothetical protein n=1 Tax=Shimia sp. TaxID=1954381 RepID=UPI003BAB7C81